MLFKKVLELIVVMFEFLLLKENYSGSFWYLNALPVQTLSLSYKLHDFRIEINKELLFSLYDQSGLEGSLAPFNLIDPDVVVPHLVNCELFA